jgi:hypothetical protein
LNLVNFNRPKDLSCLLCSRLQNSKAQEEINHCCNSLLSSFSIKISKICSNLLITLWNSKMFCLLILISLRCQILKISNRNWRRMSNLFLVWREVWWKLKKQTTTLFCKSFPSFIVSLSSHKKRRVNMFELSFNYK